MRRSKVNEETIKKSTDDKYQIQGEMAEKNWWGKLPITHTSLYGESPSGNLDNAIHNMLTDCISDIYWGHNREFIFTKNETYLLLRVADKRSDCVYRIVIVPSIVVPTNLKRNINVFEYVRKNNAHYNIYYVSPEGESGTFKEDGDIAKWGSYKFKTSEDNVVDSDTLEYDKEDEDSKSYAAELVNTLLDSIPADMYKEKEKDKERAIFIVKHAFGIGCAQMELDEIAWRVQLSRERVRQILNETLRRLKYYAKQKYGNEL